MRTVRRERASSCMVCFTRREGAAGGGGSRGAPWFNQAPFLQAELQQRLEMKRSEGRDSPG